MNHTMVGERYNQGKKRKHKQRERSWEDRASKKRIQITRKQMLDDEGKQAEREIKQYIDSNSSRFNRY